MRATAPPHARHVPLQLNPDKLLHRTNSRTSRTSRSVMLPNEEAAGAAAGRRGAVVVVAPEVAAGGKAVHPGRRFPPPPQPSSSSSSPLRGLFEACSEVGRGGEPLTG